MTEKMEKRIAETINVRINVGNFQHIELTKYAEKKIVYESIDEMKQKEDELTNELVDNLIRNMREIPDRLGKKTNAVVEVEESIQKAIPRWLEDGPEPNIANEAQEKHHATTSEQKAQKDKEEEEDEELGLTEVRSNGGKSDPDNKNSQENGAKTKEIEPLAREDDEDLFDD